MAPVFLLVFTFTRFRLRRSLLKGDDVQLFCIESTRLYCVSRHTQEYEAILVQFTCTIILIIHLTLEIYYNVSRDIFV